MIRWFGKSWGAPLCVECERVKVPVGAICSWCEEPISENDQGIFYSNGPVAHYECFMRGITGSVAHIIGDCSCYVPGSTCGDPPGMTKREAAREAVKMWELLGDLKILHRRGEL